MSEICKQCGLPREICTCNIISKEAQKIEVFVEKRRFGKMMTIVRGIDCKSVNLREVAKELKSSLACGGTSKNEEIELQGDHKSKTKPLLIKLGFPEDQIVVK